MPLLLGRISGAKDLLLCVHTYEVVIVNMLQTDIKKTAEDRMNLLALFGKDALGRMLKASM